MKSTNNIEMTKPTSNYRTVSMFCPDLRLKNVEEWPRLTRPSLLVTNS